MDQLHCPANFSISSIARLTACLTALYSSARMPFTTVVTSIHIVRLEGLTLYLNVRLFLLLLMRMIKVGLHCAIQHMMAGLISSGTWPWIFVLQFLFSCIALQMPKSFELPDVLFCCTRQPSGAADIWYSSAWAYETMKGLTFTRHNCKLVQMVIW